MLNNKGQSLILFVIILPILIFILVFVIDIGKVLVLKQELSNISEIVLDYGLDKLNINDSDDVNVILFDNIDIVNLENELIEIIKLNNKEIDLIDVRISNNMIYVVLEEKEEGIFSSIVDISIFNVKTSYVGYMDDNKKKIERVRGD